MRKHRDGYIFNGTRIQPYVSVHAFRHWLGYLLFTIFVFLIVIVLMNLLNGLAVSDISKIQKEVIWK